MVRYAEGIEISFACGHHSPIVSCWVLLPDTWSNHTEQARQWYRDVLSFGNFLPGWKRKKKCPYVDRWNDGLSYLAGPDVTEVVPAKEFWVAEEEHQNYLAETSIWLYRHYVRPGMGAKGVTTGLKNLRYQVKSLFSTKCNAFNRH